MTDVSDQLIDEVLNAPIYGIVRFRDFLDVSIEPADCIELGTPYTPAVTTGQYLQDHWWVE